MTHQSQKIIRGYEQLVQELRNHSHKLIVFDGFPGVGKTTLTTNISKELRRQLISLDNYLKKKSGNYFAELDFEKILLDLNGCEHCAIIEGLCMRRVLDQCHLGELIFVYVKKLRNNFWEDGNYLGDATRSLPPTNSTSEAIAEFCGSISGSEAQLEADSYHRNYEPHLFASVVFEWESKDSKV